MSRVESQYHDEIAANTDYQLWLKEQERTQIELREIARSGERASDMKAKYWTQVRAKLKIEFEAMGITRCEVCNAAYPLGFAHRKKRRHITDLEELRIVALLCNADHERIEYGGNMFEAITEIVESRPQRISSFG